MPSVKIMMVVTDGPSKAQATEALQPIMVTADDPLSRRPDGGGRERGDRPLDFGRLSVRPDLSLHVYVVAGDPRNDYICQILIRDMAAYALVLGPSAEDQASAASLLEILAKASDRPRLVATNWAATPEDQAGLRLALGLAPHEPVAGCNCADLGSIKVLLIALLEQVAATAPAA